MNLDSSIVPTQCVFDHNRFKYVLIMGVCNPQWIKRVMKIVFNCPVQEKGGLAMAMERNVPSLITISLLEGEKLDHIKIWR